MPGIFLGHPAFVMDECNDLIAAEVEADPGRVQGRGRSGGLWMQYKDLPVLATDPDRPLATGVFQNGSEVLPGFGVGSELVTIEEEY